jgi:hypothetical protein
MRALADAERIERFLRRLGQAASQPGRLYLTGGATAVLQGWRATTIDVDLELEPHSDEILRAIAGLKNELDLNVELAAPHHFVPELPGWRDRSVFVEQAGKLAILHYDLYSQALSKIERGHAQDLADARQMVRTGLVDPQRLLELFGEIEGQVYRYPAIDPPSFRRAVEAFVAETTSRAPPQPQGSSEVS